MTTKTKILSVVLGLALVVALVPAGASAASLTASQIQSIIGLLQSFGADASTIANVQASLSGGTPVVTGGGTGACAGITFTRNLTVGSTGSDVTCLQSLLNVTPQSGYFGPLTLAAVKAYQTSKGMIPANQVGPLTRAALNAQLAGTPGTPGTPVTPGTPGVVGFISVDTLAASPASNANITATSNVPVLGLNVKAINSNMTVNSAKVQLAVTKSSAAEHPATLLQKLYVYDGSTLLGTYAVDTNSVIKSSTNYYVILSGFNFVVPAGTTKTLTINADFAPALETDRVLTINLYDTTSVGAIDGTGATRTSGLTTSRVYTVNYDTVGTSTLTGTANTSTPASTSINVNHTSGTTDVPMLFFNAKSTLGASQLTDLVVTVNGNTADILDSVSAIKLYDGSTLVGSVSPVDVTSSSVKGTFSDINIDIAKDATKTFTVKLDMAADITTNGDNLYVTVTPSSQFTYTTPNASTGTPVGGIITGKTMYFFDGVAAMFSLVSATNQYVPNTTTPSAGYSSGVITLKVKADGGTLTKTTTANVVVHTYTDGSANGTTVSKVVSVTPDENVSDGNEATVTVNLSETRGDSGAGFVDFRIQSIYWTITDGTLTSTATQTWGLDTFKTPTANAQ